MSGRFIDAVTFGAAIGSGLVGGVFFAFSTFVMQGLESLPARDGVAAMQAINVAAINRWFLGLLFGAALACLLVAVASVGKLGDTQARWRLAGAIFYLLGTVAITVAGNVPLNEALAKLAPGAPDAVSYWTHFLTRWNMLNHVRGAASVIAAVLLLKS